MKQSLVKLLAALVDHMDLLTSQHQQNSRVLIEALEEWELQIEQECGSPAVVKNASLVKAYQGLDAMEQRLQFLRKALYSVSELVEHGGQEDYPNSLDEMMLNLARMSPVSTDSRFYTQRPERVGGASADTIDGVEGSVVLFDDEDVPTQINSRQNI